MSITTQNLSLVGHHIPEVWLQALNQVWHFGTLEKIIYDGKPVETVEVMGLRSQVLLPDKGAFPDGYIWKAGSNSWEDYRAGFLNPKNPGFAYTYGSRLRAWGAGYVYPPREVDLKAISIDQIEYIINELNRDRSSRRAIAITWVPPVDEESESPPCLMSFHAMIRKNTLNVLCNYRSHDIFGAYPANSYGLAGVMKYIADRVRLKCDMGNLTFFSESAHIYWSDYYAVSKLLGDPSGVPYAKREALGRSTP